MATSRVSTVRTLVFVRPGVLEWREAPDPVLEGDREALVRPVVASTCDLDQLVIRGQAPFEGPFSIGHECVAEIVDLGDAVQGFEVGQRVVVTWHIACGECARCRAGLTAHCEVVPYGAMFGLPVAGEWGGLFSDLVRIPFAESMLVPVLEGLDQRALASAGDNLALALECLAGHLQARPGASVLILGLGSIGLYAVQLAPVLGAGRVVYVDRDPQRRELAGSLGAEILDRPPERKTGAFDLALDAAMDEEWLQAAVQLLEPEGAFECPSIYFKESIALPLFGMTIRGVHFHTGRGNAGAHIPRLLEMTSEGAIHPERVTSEILAWDTAPEALADPSVKPVFVRDNT
jgi:threonine dehydrogenase-like Zn-dependent dehydrogenase